MPRLIKIRVPQLDSTLQLCFELLAFIKIHLGKLSKDLQLQYLNEMLTARGTPLRKIESLFGLYPKAKFKAAVNKLIDDTKWELEREDLTETFVYYLQTHMDTITKSKPHKKRKEAN